MHHWHDHFVRAENADDVAQWAILEGKSPTMRHDLLQRYGAPSKPKKAAARRIGIASDIIITLLDAWWHFRSR
jgi:hypothetical protein